MNLDYFTLVKAPAMMRSLQGWQQAFLCALPGYGHILELVQLLSGNKKT